MLSVIFLKKKKINLRVIFRQETEKLQAERMQIHFIAPKSEGDQGLKATFEMKTRLPFYQVSFPTLHPNQCFGINQLSLYSTTA